MEYAPPFQMGHPTAFQLANDVASWLPEVVRLRWAFSDITFVLMTSAITDYSCSCLAVGHCPQRDFSTVVA